MSDRYTEERAAKRVRSLSPDRSHHRSHHRSHRTRSPHRHHRSRRSPAVLDAPKLLPYNSRQLNKRDYEVFKPMFALYLDIQKSKYLEDLDEAEVKGRWKSFFGKWNRGELSEGWYDPTTLQKAIASRVEQEHISRDDTYRPAEESSKSRSGNQPEEKQIETESDSDDSVGPALPGQELRLRGNKKGPSIPNLQDLELKRELDRDDMLERREDMRFARKVDRKQQKDALDELVPRADAGTRERQLEKKAAVNEKMKSFRERSPGAVEVPESELMGGGDGINEFKQQKQEFERKKNERELRKEEILRSRAAEREERLSEYRAKEEGTMAMLKALAKQNFG